MPGPGGWNDGFGLVAATRCGGSARDREMRRMFLACGSREAIVSNELAERVAELRQKGRTPKEIARALGLRPARDAADQGDRGASTQTRSAGGGLLGYRALVSRA